MAERADINIRSTDVDSVVHSIISQIYERSRVGLEKYGTSLDRNDLTTMEWIQHTQEELMDAILYLEKLKQIFQMFDQQVKVIAADNASADKV